MTNREDIHSLVLAKVLELATEADQDELIELFELSCRIHVSIGVLTLMRVFDGQCGDPNCQDPHSTMQELVEGALRNFESDLRQNIEMNCMVNGIPFGPKDPNKEVRDEILAESNL